MKKYSILGALFLILLLSGCSTKFYTQKQVDELLKQQEDSLVVKVDNQNNSNKSSKDYSRQLCQISENINKAFQKKYPDVNRVWPIFSLDIFYGGDYDAISASGQTDSGAGIPNALGGLASFLAVKNDDDSWNILFDSNGSLGCEELKNKLGKFFDNFTSQQLARICVWDDDLEKIMYPTK